VRTSDPTKCRCIPQNPSLPPKLHHHHHHHYYYYYSSSIQCITSLYLHHATGYTVHEPGSNLFPKAHHGKYILKASKCYVSDFLKIIIIIIIISEQYLLGG
jgi:hypothetical protein